MQTNTQNIIVETNGLGSVVKIDTKAEQSRPENYEYYYDVYFVPNNGVLLETETTVWDRLDYEYHDYTDTGGEPVEYTYTYSSEDTDNISITAYDGIGLATFIGYDYKLVIEKDETDDIYEITDTYTTTISGSQDEFHLQVIGSEESASSIHYCKTRTNWKASLVDYEENPESYDDNWSDEETVYIYGKTEQPHSYTNFILFNENYQVGGIPEKYIHYPFNRVENMDRFIMWNRGVTWKNSVLGKDTDSIGYGAKITKEVNIEFTQTIGYVNRTSDEGFIPIKSGLLYSDCHFVVECPCRSTTKYTEPKKYYSDYGYSVYTTRIDNNKPRITTTTIPEVQVNGSGLDMENGLHRWLSLFYVSTSSWNYAIEGNEKIPIKFLFVDRSISDECELGTAYSQYARATRYWYNSTDQKVMIDSFSGTGAGNKMVFPIFKPYAECDLIIFHDKAGEPFSPVDY